MTVTAISIVKDEADIIAATVGHMLTQVDEVIIADNMSTDGTRDLLEVSGATVLTDNDPAHYQSRKMGWLAGIAANRGAEWVVPFDADELVYSPFGRIADVLNDIPGRWLVASSILYDHVPTAEDPVDGDVIDRIGWRRRNPAPLHKIVCRARPDLIIEDGNHHARYDIEVAEFPGHLITRHFPYRTPEQFIAKARKGSASLAQTDLSEDVGAHWRAYGRLLESGGEEMLTEVFREHFYSANPRADTGLIFDPAPIRRTPDAT